MGQGDTVSLLWCSDFSVSWSKQCHIFKHFDFLIVLNVLFQMALCCVLEGCLMFMNVIGNDKTF